jgi:hypothetical protein
VSLHSASRLRRTGGQETDTTGELCGVERLEA